MAPTDTPEAQDVATLPLVAPCRALGPGAPLRWLRRGWQDLRRAPGMSLGYGLAMFAVSAAVCGLAYRYGGHWILLAMLTGFVFVAPILAIGLYSVSAQLEAGARPSLRRCLAEQVRHRGTLMVFALVLLVIFLVWARAASMVSVFFPVESSPDWVDLLAYFGIGSAVGAVFAALTLAVSAFALPMIMERRVDAVTAAVTSVNATLRNKSALLAWALIIAAGVALSFATLLLGLILVLPVIGHATWHAYRETIDATAWPLHEAGDPG